MRFFLPLFFLLLASCAGETSYDTDPSVDMKAYRSFEICIDDMKASGTDAPEFDNDSNRLQIAAEIRKNLVAKGLEEKTGEAELLVNFDVEVSHKVQHTSSCTPTTDRQYWEECQIKEMEYDEGTLSIRFTDLAKGQVVWQGWASGVLVNRQASIDRVIEKGVAGILEPFRE